MRRSSRTSWGRTAIGVAWTYDGGHPGTRLFTACLAAGAPMVCTPGMRVLEIGCCEADWLTLAHAAWPEVDVVGIDTRQVFVVEGDDPAHLGRITRMNADAMNSAAFAPESFDAVVSISAIEHIGLGHYGDPVDPDGDSQAVANVWRWLKPGGWFYFDVPYNPEGYTVQGTECRVYDDDAIQRRLWIAPLAHQAQWLWDGYVACDAPADLVPAPTQQYRPFWYAAHVWRKT